MESGCSPVDLLICRLPDDLLVLSVEVDALDDDADARCNASLWLGVLLGKAKSLQQLRLSLDYIPLLPPLMALRHLELEFFLAASTSVFESVQWCKELESISVLHHGYNQVDEVDDGGSADVPSSIRLV